MHCSVTIANRMANRKILWMIVGILAQMEKLWNVHLMQLDVDFGDSWAGVYKQIYTNNLISYLKKIYPSHKCKLYQLKEKVDIIYALYSNQ